MNKRGKIEERLSEGSKYALFALSAVLILVGVVDERLLAISLLYII